MSQYLITAEEVATHSAIVEAMDEDEAAEVYLRGEYVEDRGETFDEDSALVLSVERLDDDDDEVA